MRRLHLTTGGESHGPGLTAILTGLPAGTRGDLDLLARDLARRQHGYGRGNRMKIEKDTAEIRGGVRDSETLGGPLVLWIANRDYANWEPMMGPVQVDPRRADQRRVHIPRPGHTDLAGGLKYQRRDLRDILERASARETTARRAAARPPRPRGGPQAPPPRPARHPGARLGPRDHRPRGGRRLRPHAPLRRRRRGPPTGPPPPPRGPPRPRATA